MCTVRYGIMGPLVWFALMIAVPRLASAFVAAPLQRSDVDPVRQFIFTTARRSQQSLNRRPQPCSYTKLNAASNGDADDEQPQASSDRVVQVESLTQDQIAELIEVSFIQACLSLAQGYVDTLKLFIVAVKASYERGNIAVESLVRAVNECPTNTAGRPLMPEEVALRSTWIHAVHLMLEHIGHPRKSDGTDAAVTHQIDSKVRERYSPLLDDVVQAKALGNAWNTNAFIATHQGVLPFTILEDQVEMAVVSQTVKVLYCTLVVLAEERLANLEEDDDDTPVTAKPKIPRGTGFN